MNKFITLIIIISLSYMAIIPILSAGFFPLHDGAHVARVYEMVQALKDGQFPVRFVADLGYGYGYPLFNFYAPLPYYFASSVYLFGVDVLVATKIMFLFGILFSFISMYLLVRRILHSYLSGLLAGVLYVYAPYHAIDIYIRGAVGEYWAMAFIPLLILGIYNVLTSTTDRKLIQASSIVIFSYSGILLSHNITGMIVTVGLGIFLLITIIHAALLGHSFKKKIILGLILILSLGICAFFWLPAISELGFTSISALITGGSIFSDHFVYLDQLWSSPWGFAGSAPGRLDGISFMVGKIHIVLSVITVCLFFINRSFRLKYKVLFLFVCTLLFLSIYMATEYSFMVWKLSPILAFVQFPWRFLLFTTFCLSFLPAFLFCELKRTIQVLSFLLLSIVIIGYNGRYFHPKEYIFRDSKAYIQPSVLQWDVSKDSDEYLPVSFKRPKNGDEIRADRYVLNSGIAITDAHRTSNELNFKAINTTGEDGLLALSYFPGWKVYANAVPVESKEIEGKISIPMSNTWTTYRAVFYNTPVRTIANVTSLVSIVVLGGMIYVYKKAIG